MTASQFDVWLVRANRVYQAVPYEVVADWLQQGRVTATDRARVDGTEPWQDVSAVPGLAVYLPQRSPLPVDDGAEALEPVELGIVIRHRRGDDDDDVDMVPLIDISLVLLIFFMMTATVAVAGSRVIVPESQYAMLISGPSMLSIGMDLGPDGQPVYSFSAGETAPLPADDNLSADAVIERVRLKLRGREAGQSIGVRVAAHHKLPFEAVQKFAGRLSLLRKEGLADIKAEVQERPK